MFPMFKDALIIFFKEFKNLRKDRGAVFANYILPAILMPIVFLGISAIGTAQQESAEDAVYPVYLVNSPGAEFESILASHLNYTLVEKSQDREKIGIEFPAGYVPGARAQVIVAFDSTSSASSFAGNTVLQAIDAYSARLTEALLAEHGLSSGQLRSLSPQIVDTAPEEAQGSSFLALMVPYLVLIFLFAGSMGMGINITAGEKEKGALAALLVNQVSRSSIALGKVLFLMVSSVIAGFMSALGIVLAAVLSPAIMQGAEFNASGLLSLGSILALLFTIVSAGAAIAALIVFLGNLSKNMKEATGYIMPIYFLVILLGAFTMSLDASSNLALFFIPLGNLVFAIKNIITSQADGVQIAITLLVNLALAGVFVAGSTKLFNSEKILDTFSA